MAKLLYGDRPSKYVERMMIIDVCRRLERIAPLSNYAYVGFGALEFVDFDLFHRLFGISKLISIEHDSAFPKRYEFNRPYKGIDLHFGEASEHLPLLDWQRLQIVWLDFVDPLGESEIRDCQTVVRSAQPGSVLLVTLNAHGRLGARLSMLQQNLGDELLPGNLAENDLDPEWGVAAIQRQVLTEQLDEVAQLRPSPVSLRQFLNFNYADNARMQTLGWVISSPGLAQTITDSRIESHDVSRTGSDALVLKLPVLTRKEADFLNRLLPLAAGKSLAVDWLAPESQAEYASLYRWYPSLV